MKRALTRGSSGQTTLEYVLMLLVAATLFVVVIKDVLRPIYRSLESGMETMITNRFKQSSMHSLKIRR